ncbi:hypothetical protein [Desulfolithobacter dissulfuricans]|nr:hypothetical protein [Desulfolithobacter dissulfuricans]
MSRPGTTALLLTVQLVIFCLLAGPALAHKVRIFAYAEGDTIIGETAFSGGRAPKDSEIIVKDAASGKILLTTRTDDHGEFSFPIPTEARQKGLDLLIVVNVGEGHRGQWKLTADEYLDQPPTPSPSPATGPTPATSIRVGPDPAAALTAGERDGTPARPEVVAVDETMLRRMMEETLDRKLGPIKRMLAESRDQGPRIQDILGGIGYLIGLAGFLAYFKAKANKGEKK